MATQITYKNAQIASFTTGTKTLKTSGKYLEADVVVTASGGGGAAISIIDESDSHGGIIRHINAVSLESDTVTASVLLSGYTAHDAEGSAITGAYIVPTPASLGSKTILSNGTYSASSDSLDGYSQVTVSVPSLSLQSKSVSPTESQQEVEPDSGYALSKVTIGAISNTYVGTSITRRSSLDLSASGATVTAPAGYYSAQATKSVSSMTLPTSVSSNATSGYTSKATISRSTSDQYINIAPGYNSAGGYYKINAVANGSVTAPSTISGTSATISTGTNTLTLTKTISVTPNVTTAGYISSGTAGNASVTLTASITTKAAATYNTSTSDQTISSGTYLTGTQTIKAVTVSGLSADKILSGTTVKIGDSNDDDRIASVSGSVVIQHYYTGSSTPSSSLGSNGDIYLQTEA